MSATSLKFGFAIFALSLLTACGGDKPKTEASAPAKETSDSSATTPPPSGIVYKVGVNTPYPPYIQQGGDGLFEGFDVDILTEIGKREGFQVEWKPRLWDGIYELLDTKELDIVASGGFDTEERRAKYAFTQPYNTETIVLITKDQNAKTFNDAKGKKISYVAGGAEEGLLKELAGSQTLDPALGNENSWSSVRQVIQGKADFALDTSIVYTYYAKQYPDQKLRIIHQDNSEVSNVAFAVKQDNQELLTKLNNGLSSIKADGTYDKMKDKWFGATTAAQ